MRGKGSWVTAGVGAQTVVGAGDTVGVVGGARTWLMIFQR